MNISKLKECVFITLKANLTPFIQGSPGLGKSAIVREIAEENKMKLIDVRLSQCDISDLNGLPKLDGKKATFLPFDVFPVEGDKVPDGYQGWLLFLDELNSANKAVQAAAYKLILDHMVGNHKLHDKVRVCAAGNLITDNAVVNQLSTALRSRLINFTVDSNNLLDDWFKWAYEHEIDARILAFIKYKPNYLFTFDPEKDDETYACPRTWEMTDKVIKLIKNLDNYKELIRGAIGTIGDEFVEYTKYANKLPKFEDIANGKVKPDPKLLEDLGMKWMVTMHLLTKAKEIKTDFECDNVLNYLIGLGKEYGAIFASNCAKLDCKVFKFPSFYKKLKEMCI